MAFVNMMDIIYPVGSVYWTSIHQSPAATVGGIWQEVKVELWNHTIVGTARNSSGDTSGKQYYRLGNLFFITGFGKNGNGCSAWDKTSTKLPPSGESGTSTDIPDYYDGIWTSQESYNFWPHGGYVENKNSKDASPWQWGIIIGVLNTDATDDEQDLYYYNKEGIYCYKRTA